MSKGTRRVLWCALGALFLGGCELIVDFDRSKIDGGGLDGSFPDAPSDVNQPDVHDATTSDVADTGTPDVGTDASDASTADASDASDATVSDASDGGDAGTTGDASDAGTTSDASDASDDGSDASQASLSITPSTQDFGTLTQNTSSSPITFTVKNDGGVTSGTITISVTGTNSGDFTTSADNCTGNTLAAGATCTVDVTFKPATNSGESATLTASATPGGSPTSTLTGTGQ